jgi:hypothetical protein
MNRESKKEQFIWGRLNDELSSHDVDWIWSNTQIQLFMDSEPPRVRLVGMPEDSDAFIRLNQIAAEASRSYDTIK